MVQKVESEIKRDSWTESVGRNDYGKITIDATINNLDEPLKIHIIAETRINLSDDRGRPLRTEVPDYTPYVPKPNQNSNNSDVILYAETFVQITITRIDGNLDEFNKLYYHVRDEFTDDLKRVYRGGKRRVRRGKTCRTRRGKKRATRRRRV